MFLPVSCRHLPTIYQAFLMSATLSEVREEERRRGEGGGVRMVGEGEVEGRVGEREGGNRGEEKEGKERERGGEREQDVAQID